MFAILNLQRETMLSEASKSQPLLLPTLCFEAEFPNKYRHTKVKPFSDEPYGKIYQKRKPIQTLNSGLAVF